MSLAAKKQRGHMYSSNINASDPLFLWIGEFVNKICTISNHAYFLIAELIPSTNGPLLEVKSSRCPVSVWATRPPRVSRGPPRPAGREDPCFLRTTSYVLATPPLVHYPTMVVLSPPASHLVRESPINGRQTRRTGDDLRPPRQYQNQQGLPTHGNQVPWWSQGSPMSTVTVSKPEPMSKSCICEAPKTISGYQSQSDSCC